MLTRMSLPVALLVQTEVFAGGCGGLVLLVVVLLDVGVFWLAALVADDCVLAATGLPLGELWWCQPKPATSTAKITSPTTNLRTIWCCFGRPTCASR